MLTGIGVFDFVRGSRTKRLGGSIFKVHWSATVTLYFSYFFI